MPSMLHITAKRVANNCQTNSNYSPRPKNIIYLPVPVVINCSTSYMKLQYQLYETAVPVVWYRKSVLDIINIILYKKNAENM